MLSIVYHGTLYHKARYYIFPGSEGLEHLKEADVLAEMSD